MVPENTTVTSLKPDFFEVVKTLGHIRRKLEATRLALINSLKPLPKMLPTKATIVEAKDFKFIYKATMVNVVI